MLKVKKNQLLYAAGGLWLAAGVNILRIGTDALIRCRSLEHPWLQYIGALSVFIAFMAMFRRIVGKHKRRILAYPQERRSVFDCFDRKGYLLMFFMMTLGIVLRRFAQLPLVFFAVFYTGLGAALSVSGVRFICAGAALR